MFASNVKVGDNWYLVIIGPRPVTDNLMYDFLQNYTELSSKGYSVALLRDFNGRCLKRYDFTKLNVISGLPSYNGTRLCQFVEASEPSLTNCLSCCNGFVTRILNNQMSAIDNVRV